ncbi:hypothetical protein FVE85_5692 [Porphyridium purpureum]|uniref:Uncharacterized protein n=1 Tax=Porphyridium purpureum TaxID=35688 RepID=A0A5J4Z635_PORPP|nr:hypothetical protein FVE85_5692 [Porphyridium purpureum]|eukprot:POR3565..scf295_1
MAQMATATSQPGTAPAGAESTSSMSPSGLSKRRSSVPQGLTLTPREGSDILQQKSKFADSDRTSQSGYISLSPRLAMQNMQLGEAGALHLEVAATAVSGAGMTISPRNNMNSPTSPAQMGSFRKSGSGTFSTLKEDTEALRQERISEKERERELIKELQNAKRRARMEERRREPGGMGARGHTHAGSAVSPKNNTESEISSPTRSRPPKTAEQQAKSPSSGSTSMASILTPRGFTSHLPMLHGSGKQHEERLHGGATVPGHDKKNSKASKSKGKLSLG